MDLNLSNQSDEEAASLSEEKWEIINDVASENMKKITAIHATNIDGMVMMNLSKITQQIIGCEIGKNVTTEYPWIFIKKDIVEDNLDLHTESSDFLPIQNEILQYPDKMILIGLASTKNTDDDFYICLTEHSRDTIIKEIELLRSKQEIRVKNCVFREINSCAKLKDIHGDKDDSKVSFFEIPITVRSKFFETSIALTNRNADQQRDSSVQLTPMKMTLNNNIINKLVSRHVDTNPLICNKYIQTASLKPINSWFQYTYDHTNKPINIQSYNEDETRAIEQFLHSRQKYLYDKVLSNTLWDIHCDDSMNLIKNNIDTQIPVPSICIEYQTYHNTAITKDKIINDLSWHPLWMDIAIVAYGSNNKNVTDVYQQENNNILIWSLSNSLRPKLILDCPREVNTLHINPIYGNIIIGGCCNGQLMVWLIEEKNIFQGPSTIENKSKCNHHLKNLMKWMKQPKSVVEIYPIVITPIESSQKAAITQIIFLSKFQRINKNGQFQMSQGQLDDGEESVGQQIITSSEDGTIVFWNIEIISNSQGHIINSNNDREKIPIQFHELHYNLIPIYTLVVKHMEMEYNIVITTMSIFTMNDNDDIDNHTRSVESLKIILLGSSDGDVGAITWNGLDFPSELSTNCEVARWLWCNDVTHDGPVTHLVRSKYLNDVVVTVGGRTFAIWNENFSQPILMKQSAEIQYTAVSWGISRPTLLILARADGTIEIWDFLIKSHEAIFIQTLASSAITGIHTHHCHQANPQYIAFSDSNGAMRIFFAPKNFSTFQQSDITWMKSFINEEINRIKEFESWQCSLNKQYDESIKLDKEQDSVNDDIKKNLAINEKDQVEMANIKENKISLRDMSHPSIEKSKSNWKMNMLKQMQNSLLEKKGLKIIDIDKRQAPVLQLRKEEEYKRTRVIKYLQTKDEILNNILNLSFPEKNYKNLQQEKIINENHINYETNAENIHNERLKIIQEYEEISKEITLHMEQHMQSFEHSIDWRRMIKEGERRRRSLDIDLKHVMRKRYRAPIIKPDTY